MLPDQSAQTVLDFAVSGHWSLFAILRVGINIMFSSMPLQVAPFISQTSDEIPPFQVISIVSSVE